MIILKNLSFFSIISPIIDELLKETTTRALEENKIKPAGQPKLDLKTYGEDKELEYVLSVTELTKIDVKAISDIKFDQYIVKIDQSETEKTMRYLYNRLSPVEKEIAQERGTEVTDAATNLFGGLDTPILEMAQSLSSAAGFGKVGK